MEKIVIVNCQTTLANSYTKDYPCNIFEPKEINDYLSAGFIIASKEIVTLPQSSTNFSIVFRLRKD